MHNKFMVVDNMFLVTGSFNWTFQAGSHNQENLVVVDGEFYIKKYNEEFNKLWAQFSGNELEHAENKAALLIQKRYKGNQAAKKVQAKRKPVDPNNPWGLN